MPLANGRRAAASTVTLDAATTTCTGNLHVAAQTYRQNGNDFWPGPLDASGNLDRAQRLGHQVAVQRAVDRNHHFGGGERGIVPVDHLGAPGDGPKFEGTGSAFVFDRSGGTWKLDVELIAPIAMDEGLRFAIREGGRTVGAGVVAKIIE